MENRINQVLTLADGTQYYVMKQAIYKNDNYFVCCRVENEKAEDEFIIFHECKGENDNSVEMVKDPHVIQLLFQNLQLG